MVSPDHFRAGDHQFRRNALLHAFEGRDSGTVSIVAGTAREDGCRRAARTGY